ncbi:mitogen-activated protein kinase kinase kinase 1-like [Gastrolobium bilobum]|uniref:mitogen-activated protein kinase kinase kinase 1-like n=1 Tax=Gastrolobium bilobum TaxID=150636 RepID=UPI002AB2A2B7|nr:mitogen-activated protein kinase kinase kinase 1-like [Gastrolobium bilobum]
MEGDRKRLKPRLERRNAMKKIDYEPDDEIETTFLENQTSFRIDGEFDHIFRSLGLSGPEDFAIPTAAWEQAQKARFFSSSSSSSSPPPKLESGDAVVVLKKQENEINRDGGIKGVRPPLLEQPPPPLVDKVTSAWHLTKSLPLPPQHDDVVVVVGEEHGISDSTSSMSHDDDDDDDDDSDVGDETEKADMSIHNVSPNGSFTRTFKSWQKGEVLGKGSFGTVYEGFTDDGDFFAVKEVSLLDEGSQGKQSIFQLQQEISLLSQFKHENIVRYIGTDKDNDKLYIFLELVTKGSLASLYQKYSLRDSQVSAYTRQILSGLKYLHDRNVVHRDIKCANILVDADGFVKLADFGLAKATKLNDVKSSKGSPYWMAPEVVNLRNRGYGLAADIWSLGCTVLEMLTRQPPYSHLEGMQALFRIGRGQPPPIPESLSEDAGDFILKCLQVNPNKRPTAAQLLDHPFVKRPLLSPISLVSPRTSLLLS